MDSGITAAILTTLLLLYHPVLASDVLPPLLSPFFDNVCKGVECGRGKCKAPERRELMFECECEPGWKQAFSGHNFTFLPCVIPNCTFNLGCGEAPPPVHQRSVKNDSFFDPCRWTNCGGGSCNKTSDFTYNCECEEGYANLLNISSFPCFRELCANNEQAHADCYLSVVPAATICPYCRKKRGAIGMDCKNLGLNTPNTSLSPRSPPALSDKSKDNAGLRMRHKHWSGMVASTILLAAFC